MNKSSPNLKMSANTNRRIILLTGLAGSGKDTTYAILQRLFAEKDIPTVQYAFGRPLKEIVVQLSKLYLNADFSVESMNSLAYKETPWPNHIIYKNNEPEHLIIRTLLQQIGTDIMRKHLGDDIFAQAVIRQIDNDFKNSQKPHIAIITDLRFPNELQCIQTYCLENGIPHEILHIKRNGQLQSHAHSSESHYDSLPLGRVIHNNGSLEDLETELRSQFLQ